MKARIGISKAHDFILQKLAKGCIYFSYKNAGFAKVSCTSGHQGVQLILAYSWARPAILVACKGRRGMFLFLLFLHFHSCSSFFPVLSFISSTISSISFLPVSGRRHKMTHKCWRVVKPQHNQSIRIEWIIFIREIMDVGECVPIIIGTDTLPLARY